MNKTQAAIQRAAEIEAWQKSEWSKTKGYGIYELVELEVEDDKCNC